MKETRKIIRKIIVWSNYSDRYTYYISIKIYVPSVSDKSGFPRNFNLKVNNLLNFPAESESDLELIAVIHDVISVTRFGKIAVS